MTVRDILLQEQATPILSQWDQVRKVVTRSCNEGELQCYKNETTSSQTSGNRKVWTACTFVHALKILIWASRKKCVKVRTPQKIHTSLQIYGCTDKLQMLILGHMPQFNDMIASPLLDLFRSTKTSCENGSFEDA